MTSETFTQVVASQIRYPIENPSPERRACRAPTTTLPLECDDVEGEASASTIRIRPSRTSPSTSAPSRERDHRRAADGRQVDLHRELRVLPHARRRRNVGRRRAEPRRVEAAEGARRRPRDERPGRDARRSRTRSTSSRSRRSQTTSRAPRASSAGATSPASAARSTTTCVTGTSKRARTDSTTPRSSQFDLPGGCVEITISLGPNVRTASSTATSGSPSPTSPLASMPTDASRASVASSRSCAAARAGSSSDVYVLRREFSAGQTTRNSSAGSARAC